ncbi:uncharacterized protein LOC126965393 [Leptidea sinapis]|uniref:uncharacterized protein LOC126965393 n=1 Tax=Leptidea sinapis TaxID=189913 RepID=UPI00212C9DD5|nr:uncharacterized protein LOC126965393 [Leptidea sinapis]
MEDNNLSLQHFSQNIQQSIRNICEKERFIEPKLFIRNVTGDNNFMGELYEIDIEGTTSDGPKTKNIFIKRIVDIEGFKVYSIPEVFAKEEFVYNELLKAYNELEDEANIPDEERLNTVMSFDETSSEAIVLENIKKNGYLQTHKFDAMTLEIAEKSIEQLAKFHGLSFVLEHKRPTYFQKRIKTIKQSFVYDTYWDELAEKFTNISIAELDDDMKDRVNKFLPISLVKYPKYMTGATNMIKCLCHGDYKMNNIMYKKKDESLHVIPIDFQQIYFGNPIIDLIYFIYASSEREFRKTYRNHLKDYYYDSIDMFLKHFKMDFKCIYPKDEFDKCFNECLDYALMFCLYMYPFLFSAEDSEKTDDINCNFRVDVRLKDRIKGVLEDFIDLGII